MDDKEKTVGAILKEARLAKGISLADAEKATSIRSRYLQAVENDEYVGNYELNDRLYVENTDSPDVYSVIYSSYLI